MAVWWVLQEGKEFWSLPWESRGLLGLGLVTHTQGMGNAAWGQSMLN